MTSAGLRRAGGLLVATVVAALAAALGVLSAVTPAPAAGQEAPPSSGGMRLVEQTAWVEPNGTFEIVLALPGVYDFDDQAIVAVHERVRDTEHLRETLSGNELGDVLGTVTTTLGALTPSPQGEASIQIVLLDDTVPDQTTGDQAGDTDDVGEDAGHNEDDDVERIVVSTPGVYPVSVSLRTAEQAVIGRIVTHAVRVPSTEGIVPRMPVATVLDLDAGPSEGPGSVPAPDELAGIRTWIGPLSVSDLPATLRVTPWLFDARGTSVLPDQLRGIAAGREVGRAPWVRIDEAALANAGMAAIVDEIWTRGDQTLGREIGVQPNAGLWVSDGDDPPSRRRYGELADQGITALVVPSSAIDAESSPPPAEGGMLDVGGDRFQTLVSMSEATDAIDGATDPVLAAHHLLAELAVRALQGDRAATVMFHSEQDIDPRAAEVYVEALAASVLHRPTTAGAVVDRVPTGPTATPLVPVDGPVPELGGDTALLDQAYESLNGYRSMVFDPDTNLLYDPLRNDLWVSFATGIDPEIRNEVWREIDSRVLEEVDAITPPPPIEVLLTARDGLVPFSFDNALDYPVRVEVRFVSDKVTLVDTDDGETATLVLDPGLTSREFTVRALTSGRFPLEVVIRSPDGTLALADQRVNVRSTALSGIGVAVAVGAAAFLALWWLLGWRRRRRGGRPIDEPFWTATRLSDKAGAAT